VAHRWKAGDCGVDGGGGCEVSPAVRAQKKHACSGEQACNGSTR
jgi:hypothetical protein